MSTRPTLTRRHFGTLLAGSLVAGVTACGSDTDTSAAAGAAAPAAPGTFPVTVAHLWG